MARNCAIDKFLLIIVYPRSSLETADRNGSLISSCIPDPLTFTKPEEWPKWIRWFEHFRIASGLFEKSEETQVNTFIYSMGMRQMTFCGHSS